MINSVKILKTIRYTGTAMVAATTFIYSVYYLYVIWRK